MTDCNRQTLTFSSLGPKTIAADFHGGHLTTDAGALLLREVDQHLGLIDALDAAIPDPRRPELIAHEQKALGSWARIGNDLYSQECTQELLRN
jgi:hypothetical protein